jgi:hypothetical protein
MASTLFLLFTMGMKNNQNNLMQSILVGLFVAVGAVNTMATPAPWVRHNNTGWTDAQHQSHAYVIHPVQGNSPGLPERFLSDTPAAL